MRYGLRSAQWFSLAAVIVAMISPLAAAMDDRPVNWGPPRVHVLLIIDRLAGLSGTSATERNVLRAIDAMRSGGMSVDVTTLDSGVSPDSIRESLARIKLGGQDSLFVYYLGHGGMDPFFGHVLGTTGGMLPRSKLQEAVAAMQAHLKVVLTDSCSNQPSQVAYATGSLTGVNQAAPTVSSAGPDTARILSSLFLDNEGIVDVNASSWSPQTGRGEFAWHNVIDGGLFTLAFTRLLMESRFDQLDRNRDGIVAWSELELPLKTVSGWLYDQYKSGFMNGRYPINANELPQLYGQVTQTPQFHSMGWPSRLGLASTNVPHPAPAPLWGSRPEAGGRQQQGLEELARLFADHHDSLPGTNRQPVPPTAPSEPPGLFLPTPSVPPTAPSVPSNPWVALLAGPKRPVLSMPPTAPSVPPAPPVPSNPWVALLAGPKRPVLSMPPTAPSVPPAPSVPSNPWVALLAEPKRPVPSMPPTAPSVPPAPPATPAPPAGDLSSFADFLEKMSVKQAPVPAAPPVPASPWGMLSEETLPAPPVPPTALSVPAVTPTAAPVPGGLIDLLSQGRLPALPVPPTTPGAPANPDGDRPVVPPPPPSLLFGYGAAATAPAPSAPADRPVRLGVNLVDHAGYVVIASVLEATPASRIGMRAGDVILAVNGVPVRSVQEFLERMHLVPPWGHVRLYGRTGPGGQIPVVPVAYETDLVR